MQRNDRVSWYETYRTSGNVIASRTCWGTVMEIYQTLAGLDGHEMGGVYVEVQTLDGDCVNLHYNDIVAVQTS